MSFLKEFKEDLSMAVSELVSEKAEDVETENDLEEESVDTLDDEMVNTLDPSIVEDLDLDTIGDLIDVEDKTPLQDETDDEIEIPVINVEPDLSDIPDENTEEYNAEPEPEIEPEEVKTEEKLLPSDEVTEITKGTSITGNISSTGSINVYGNVVGDVNCRGKLIITGTVRGVSSAGEIFANNSKIEGDVKSEGSVKVGNGSIIIGNIYATSAVIGGAVKGDIDVHGPVIVDATAVIQGNIKSRSVQINNGAAIEGFCSQCYADVDYKALFDETFGN